MENILHYDDYREYLNDHVVEAGPGAKRIVAGQMGISPSLFSQILSGERSLGLDQAFRFALTQSFNAFEKMFWVGLVEFEIAGTTELKEFFRERILSMRDEAEFKSRSRLGLKRTTWSKEFVAVFYSSWHVPAVYCLLGTADTWTPQELACRLQLPLIRVQSVIDFFERHEIVNINENSSVSLCSKGYVYLDGKDTEMHAAAVLNNCKNFRQLAMSRLEDCLFESDKRGESKTVTALISEKDLQDLRQEVQRLFRRLNDCIAESSTEAIVCLNIDLFKI